MRLAIAAVALLAAAPLAAATLGVPSGKYANDPAHTSVTFRIMHLGLSNYTARLTKIVSTVDLNAADVAKSKLAVAIDPKSVKTDFPFADKVDFDAEIGSGDKFLDGKAFPEIKFVSTGIVLGSGKSAKISGLLTLRGVTKPVVLDAVLNGTMQPNAMFKVPAFGVSATAHIKRSEWGMTYGTQFVGDDVELLIQAEYRPVG